VSNSFHGGPSALRVFTPPLHLIDKLRPLISKELPSSGCLGVNWKEKPDTRSSVEWVWHPSVVDWIGCMDVVRTLPSTGRAEQLKQGRKTHWYWTWLLSTQCRSFFELKFLWKLKTLDMYVISTSFFHIIKIRGSRWFCPAKKKKVVTKFPVYIWGILSLVFSPNNAKDVGGISSRQVLRVSSWVCADHSLERLIGIRIIARCHGDQHVFLLEQPTLFPAEKGGTEACGALVLITGPDNSICCMRISWLEHRQLYTKTIECILTYTIHVEADVVHFEDAASRWHWCLQRDSDQDNETPVY
jgi:hypothetical protein